MTARPRLFARTREQFQDIRPLSPENFIIALLDIYTDDTYLSQEFSHLPNCHYFRASTINDCADLIMQEEAENALIILIISNRFLDTIREYLLPMLSQISHIYLFDRTLCNQLFSNDLRFRGAFDDISSLIAKIEQDIEEARQPAAEAQGVQFILEENASFFWYRFFFNILDRLQYTQTARNELISRLRDEFHGKEHELSRVHEFEDQYESANVIWWYTCPGFFYSMLNKALREKDINDIFVWRLCIHDLHENLRQLHSVQKDHFQSLFLHRGQFLHIDGINNLRRNIGKLVIMNSFLSTSLCRDMVRMFAGDGTPHGMLQSILIRINADSDCTGAIFADIQSESSFREEQEILFSLRSLFRIDQVEYIDDIWQIDLTAVDEDDEEFCRAINPWKAAISEQSFFAGRHEPLFTRYLTIENSAFLAFQLLIDLMLRLNRTSYARDEMIEMCRLKYVDSPSDLKKIDEFEQTYRHEDASKWYTTDSFLYRLLNNSLRLEDIDTLFKLRYYIYDLHNQLAQLQIPYVRSLPSDKSILTLYRGQRMTITELNKLQENVGKLISKNSFLSTTSDVTAAIFFSGDGSLDNPDGEASVLYEITVDTKIPHMIPFARIDYLSVYEDEDEFLFSMASVFQIEQVEQYGNLWVVNLTLINKEDEEWNKLTAHLNK